MGIKKGTKLTDAPKDKTIKIRIDAKTEVKLNAVSEYTKKNKSEVIRAGIEKQYAEIQDEKGN